MHFAVLVVGQRILLEGGDNHVIANKERGVGGGFYHQFQNVEQFAGIAAAVTQQGIGFLQFDTALFQDDVGCDGPL